MKITKFTVLFLIVCFLFGTSTVESQVKTKTSSLKRPPGFLIEFNLSYSQPLPNMMGDIGEQFNFKNYGVNKGFGSQLYFKLVTDKKGKMRPFLTIGYDLFLNSNKTTAYIPNNITTHWPNDTAVTGTVAGTSKMYLHDFSFGAGFEYAFVNKTTWTPYANFDFTMNMLFGTYKQTPNSTGLEVAYTYKNATRLGIGVGFGVNGRFTKSFGISIGAKWRMPNLLLKDSKLSQEVNKFYLNDKEDTSLSKNLTKDRNLMYLQFYVGAAFYLGKK
ncbi:MAG: hypothetical protein IT280_03040 [Ignavibacteria bacterium]|nr:hypothetical protein [Ignavibacteria bacterium]